MGEYHIGDALKKMIGATNLRNGVRAAQIGTVWEQIMGKTIAKYTDRVQIINHTLFIHTVVGPLKNELAYQKPQIIARVNEALGEDLIKEVIIK